MNFRDFQSQNSLKKDTHALVIGGSIAGLLASRILTNHFERVTIIERDRLPQDPIPRPGVPQAYHVHVLLKRGRDILEQLFPGLQEEIMAKGVHLIDMTADLTWLTPVGWSVSFPSDLKFLSCSRSLLEWCIRQRISALPQIDFLQEYKVKSLLPNEDNTGVAGVSVSSCHQSDNKGEQLLSADLVVDASGRSSKAPQWLDILGYPTPQETTIDAHLGYASRICQLPSDFQRNWRALYIEAAPPRRIRAGVFYPLEDNRWIVSLSGGDGDYPPTDEVGFLKFADSLPSSLFYEALAIAKPLSPIYSYRGTKNRLRHYERLTRWPKGLAIMGDAVCAFNPIYGQGMTAAAMEALTLDRLLRKQRRCRPDKPLGDMTRHFQKQLAKVNATPWQLATSADYKYRSTIGGSPNWTRQLMYRYLEQVLLLSNESFEVRKLLLDVFNLLQAPTILFHPRIIMQVFVQAFKRTSSCSLGSQMQKNTI